MGKAPEVRKLLLLGADSRKVVEEGDFKGFSPLLAAVQGDHVEVFQALTAEGAGADPNQVEDEYSCSSLHIAAGLNQPLSVAALVRAGANVDLADCSGQTPLCHGSREALIALLVARAMVNVVAEKGATPLFFAAQDGLLDILKLLIKAWGNVNLVTNSTPSSSGTDYVGGFSPLMIATQGGFLEVVELLLANGANVHHKSDRGYTALDAAKRFNHPSIEAVLRAHIARLAATERAGG